MPFRFPFLAVVLSAASVSTASGNARAGTTADTVDVDHLIAAYHQAVLAHDGARLAALFVPQGSAWFSVLTDDGLARVRARKPDAPKVRPGRVQDFVAMVSAREHRLDPEQEALQVRGDDAVATVTFRFRFLVDGREQNRGNESWQLIRSADGWRIASIVYSSTPSFP